MKKILGLIVIILLFAYIPIYSIWPIDYSSKTANILILLGNMQIIIIESLSNLITFIAPIILSLLNTIAGLIFQAIEIILSLPYKDINPVYLLIGLFIVAYFFEKFRVINNEISKLNKKLLKHISSNKNNSEKPLADHMDEIHKLNNKADSIMLLLSEINNAADIFKSTGFRSKKMRRETLLDTNENNAEEVVSFSDLDRSVSSEDSRTSVSDEIIDDNTSQAVRDEKRAKDEEQLMRLRKDIQSLAEQVNTASDDNLSQAVRDEKCTKDEEQLMRLRKDIESLAEQVNTANDSNLSQAGRDEKRAKDEEQLMRLRKDAESLAKQDKESEQFNTVDEIIEDDNISQIDLVRALIASNEIDDAKNLLKRIVEMGSEDDKHEARLLFMQIK